MRPEGPYRSPLCAVPSPPSWRRRLVATLPLPTRWQRTRRARGGHWEQSHPYLGVHARRPSHDSPSLRPGRWHRVASCQGIDPATDGSLPPWSGHWERILCEDHGPVVPTLALRITRLRSVALAVAVGGIALDLLTGHWLWCGVLVVLLAVNVALWSQFDSSPSRAP
jgi:hypothetical protein